MLNERKETQSIHIIQSTHVEYPGWIMHNKIKQLGG